MSIGDIHWVELPAVGGHEQAGRRPALLLQDDAYAGQSPVVLAVPLTTALASQRFPATVTVQPTAENGLRDPSVALVFQLRAVDRRRVREKMGMVSAEVLAQIFAALDQLVGRTRPTVPPPAS